LEQLFCLLFALLGFLFHSIDYIGENLPATHLRHDRGSERRGINGNMQEGEMGAERTRYSQRRGEDAGIRIASCCRDENGLDHRMYFLLAFGTRRPLDRAITGRRGIEDRRISAAVAMQIAIPYPAATANVIVTSVAHQPREK